MDKKQKSTEAGVLLTPGDVEQPTIGKVVAVGNGLEDADGALQPPNVEVGSSVLYSRYTGAEFEVGEEGETRLWRCCRQLMHCCSLCAACKARFTGVPHEPHSRVVHAGPA